LSVALEDLEQGYDLVILDTSPQRSLLSVNALAYIHEAIIPVDPGLFAVAGLGQLQQAIEDVRRFIGNRELRIAGIVLTRSTATAVARDVETQLRATFGELVHVATIPANVRVEEAHSRYQAVVDYAPRSAGAKAYSQLVEEIIANGQRTKARAGKPARRVAPIDDAA
jgi:chromosome partitioning protein